MTGTDDQKLRSARDTAYAIVEVIGTRDWSDRLADRTVAALVTDETRRREILVWLGRTREEVTTAAAEDRAAVKGRAYEEWTDHIVALLTEQLTTRAGLNDLQLALEIARGGVRGWGGRRGVLPDSSPELAVPSERDEQSYRGSPPGSDFGADDRGRRPPGSGFGAGDR